MALSVGSASLGTALLQAGCRLLANPLAQGFTAAVVTKGVGSGMRVYADWKGHAPVETVKNTAKREGTLLFLSAAFSGVLNIVLQKRFMPWLLKIMPKAGVYSQLIEAALIGVSILIAEGVSRFIAPPRTYFEQQRDMMLNLLKQVMSSKSTSGGVGSKETSRQLRSDVSPSESPLRFADTFTRTAETGPARQSAFRDTPFAIQCARVSTFR